MPSASVDGSGPRYAPEDPTLPEPWKGLVDGSTGYLYYWNPITNVTQYEKPVKEKLPGPPPLPPPPAKPASMSVSSSVHRGEPHAEDGRSRNHQYQVGRPSGSHSLQGSGDTGHGHGHNSSHSSRATARAHGSSDAGGGLSPEEYRRQHEITIIGDDIPPPYMTFEATGFPSEILKEVHRANFAAPTPIQAQSWPIALQSRDIVAIAKTGSGKTLGYLIPGFIHLKRLRNNPRVGPTVLVLAPTRELATQIQDEADKFGRSSKISCTCVYGGAPKGPQLRDLDRGIDVVVATPGRLNDILEMRRVDLRQVSYLVLDEADRMLDMGFEPQIRKIVKEIPHRRQTLMFTATWPKEVRKIAADLLVHPVQVYIGNIDELVANKAITQYVEVIKPIEKQRRLEQILRSQEPGSKVIIFCSTKRMCDQLARTLTRQFGAAAIHGDKNQSERDRVLGHFRTGRSPILVATDVAARGLDIKDIRVVINYDFPTGVEDYVHRIGRTGRAGATGVSYTFFSDQDSKYARELVKVLEGAGQRVPPELRDMVSHGGYGGRSRRWGSGARDQGRSNGLGHGDSGYASRDGHVLPPSGRADGDRGVYRSERDSHDRCDRGRGHRDRHDGDARVHQDSKTTSRGSIRSRSNSRSLSPRAEARVRQDTKPIPKSRVRSRSHSRSLSASPKRGPVAWSHSRSRSRSRSRSLDHAWSRCRSNSRGANRAMDRYGRSTSAPRQSPVLKKGEALAGDHFRDQSDRSQVPPHSPQRRKSSPASYDDGEIRDDQLDPSPSLRKERSRSPIQSRDDRLDSPRGLRKEGSRSPIQSRDDRLDHSRGLRKERSRSPIQSREDRLDRPRSLRKERSRSPIQPRDDRLNRLRGLGKERSRSPIQSRDDRLNRPTRGLRKDRSRSPIQSRDDQRDRPTRGLRKVRSRSPIQSTDEWLDRPCSPRKVRSRSPSQSRADRLDRPCSPRKVVRSQSPYTDNGRRGGSLSPLEWPQKSPNRANGTEGPPIGKPVQSQPLACDGDEEEEGMIHPDEDTISPTEK